MARMKAYSRVYHAAHCRLPWNGWRSLRKPIVITRRPLYDYLMSCAIWRWRTSRKLRISGHTSILGNSSDILTRNYTLESLRVNFVSPYTYVKEWKNLTNKFEGRRMVSFYILLFFCSLISVSFCDFFFLGGGGRDVKWSEHCACHF
jgi:hypothetical protein